MCVPHHFIKNPSLRLFIEARKCVPQLIGSHIVDTVVFAKDAPTLTIAQRGVVAKYTFGRVFGVCTVFTVLGSEQLIGIENTP